MLFDWTGETLLAGDVGTFTILRREGQDVALLYAETPDVERAKSFFADLLGWTYEADDSGSTTIQCSGRRQGPGERRVEPSWLPYLRVHSADDAVLRADRLEGRLSRQSTRSAIGRFAVLADPQGATFAVVED